MPDRPIVDFETKPIIFGSGLAPRPVGVSIELPGQRATYYGWGHPGANPHTFEYAKTELAKVWDHRPIFHNSKFDIGVAVEHMGFDWPTEFDDTLYLLYLDNPIADSLSLKPSAARLLGEPPEEQDRVRDWLIQNWKRINIPLVNGDKGVNKTNFGAYISYAPYEIVDPYARGDTGRTGRIFDLLRTSISQRNMDRAYERELALTRIGYDMEADGIRVDRAALARDYEIHLSTLHRLDLELRGLLGDYDFSKPAELARAIELSPLGGSLPRTPTGRLSTAKDAFEGAISDRRLLRALRHRSTLLTLTGTFYANWLKFSARDGNVHPSWNQVRGEKFGTRTGRFSCSEPNFQNVPTEFDDEILQDLGLPFMRRYILPDKGKVIVPADYNGQEMRILAHYAEGKAAEIYQTDPGADFHVVAAQLVHELGGFDIGRKRAKITGFSLIYGSGVTALSKQLGVDYDTAYKIKKAYLDAIPGLSDFIDSFEYREQVKTWGGRILPVEPAKMYKGSLWTFNYKLCNYLIQGSAADQNKEAMIRYDKVREEGDLLLTVHDEDVIQVEEEHLHSEVNLLRWAMENQEGWDVPFLCDVEYGPNWHDLKPYRGEGAKHDSRDIGRQQTAPNTSSKLGTLHHT